MATVLFNALTLAMEYVKCKKDVLVYFFDLVMIIMTFRWLECSMHDIEVALVSFCVMHKRLGEF